MESLKKKKKENEHVSLPNTVYTTYVCPSSWPSLIQITYPTLAAPVLALQKSQALRHPHAKHLDGEYTNPRERMRRVTVLMKARQRGNIDFIKPKASTRARRYCLNKSSQDNLVEDTSKPHQKE